MPTVRKCVFELVAHPHYSRDVSVFPNGWWDKWTIYTTERCHLTFSKVGQGRFNCREGDGFSCLECKMYYVYCLSSKWLHPQSRLLHQLAGAVTKGCQNQKSTKNWRKWVCFIIDNFSTQVFFVLMPTLRVSLNSLLTLTTLMIWLCSPTVDDFFY